MELDPRQSAGHNEPIEIRKIRLGNLLEFARSAFSDPAYRKLAPISLLRAASQVENPIGDPDDLALVVALHADRCIGYHGLLPGHLCNHERSSKIFWLVTFYIDPEFRGRGLGRRLVDEIQQQAVDLVTTGITAGAEGVYRSAGFKRLGELPYDRIRMEKLNFRNTLGHMTDKNPDRLPSASSQNLAGLSYTLAKWTFYRFVSANLNCQKKKFRSRAVPQLAEGLKSVFARQSADISFCRGIETINWMLRHPWVVSRAEAEKDVENYYFSRVRDFFKFVALEIFAAHGNTRKGFLVLSISRHKHKTHVKIMDFHFFDPEDAYIAGCCGIEYARQYLAYRIEYPAALHEFFSGLPFIRRLITRKKRLYLFFAKDADSPLTAHAGRIILNYCDSDTAFT